MSKVRDEVRLWLTYGSLLVIYRVAQKKTGPFYLIANILKIP